MPSRTVETVFKFRHDRAAAQALLRDQNRIDDALQDTVRSSSRVEDAYTEQERAAKRLAKTQAKVAETQIRAAREGSELYGDIASRTSAFSGLASGLGGGAFGGRLMIAADILDAVEAAKLMKAEFPALIAQMGLSTGKIIALAGAGGALALAAYGVSKALKDEEEAHQRALESAQNYITGLLEARARLRTGTTEEINQTIDDLRTGLRGLESDRDTINRWIDSLSKLERQWRSGLLNIDEMRAIFAEMGKELPQDFNEFEAVLETLKKENKDIANEITNTAAQINTLNQGLSDSATVAADLAIREKEISDLRLASLEADVNEELERANLLRSRSAETIREEIATLRDAIPIHERAAETYLNKLELDENAATLMNEHLNTVEQYNQRLKLLNEILPEIVFEESQREKAEARLAAVQAEATESANRLEEAIKAVTKAQEEARKAGGLVFEESQREKAEARLIQVQKEVTQSSEALADASEGVADAQRLHTEYMLEQAEADADRALKAQQEQEDFERQRVQDLADHYVEMAQLDADYYRDRQDILDDLSDDLADIDQERLDDIKDYNKESRRLAEDHRDRLLDIQRRTDIDYQEAARNRDTVGALAALRRGKQALDDEDRQYQKEQKRREEDFKDELDLLARERRERQKAARDQLRDLEQQHRREEAERNRAFRQRLAREDQERAIQQQRLQAEYQREDAARRAHYSTVENATTQHFSSVYGRTQTGFANIEAAYSAHIARVNAIVGGASGAVSGGTRTPTEYALGGSPPLNRLVSVGERRPETAVFANGRREIIGRSGRELALFKQPVRIYPSAAAGGQNVNLSLGGINIQGAGMSSRNIARQVASQVDDMVFRALEKIVSEAEL